jgi:hypothetical protein
MLQLIGRVIARIAMKLLKLMVMVSTESRMEVRSGFIGAQTEACRTSMARPAP